MKIVGFLMLLCISFTNSYFMDRDLQPINENTVTYKYDRIDEVKRECAFVLDSALELKPGYNRMNGIGIKKELSFINGDWWQEANGVSLMPFDGRDVPNNSSTRLNLVSFWVSDVDRSHLSEKSVSVSGIVQMGITLEDSFVQKPYEGSPRFDIWPGQSQLSVLLQGIYTESQDNGGERVLCLLGNAMLPSRDPGSTDHWEWVKGFGYANEPPLLQDDQILLVLRYPKTPTLTNRAIRGSMRSLNPKSNLKYFDEVQISSGLGTSAKYEFSSDKIVSKACSPYPYKDNLMKGGIDIYKGLYFCLILKQFTQGEAMIVVPNWRCNGNDDFCSKLGPFGSDKEIKATNGSFKDVKLVLQDVQCEKELSRNNGDFSRVSAVFRAVSPSEKQFHAAQRTGLNNMTLSADGVWNSSSGQLCMVGCLGIVDVQGNGCKSRICLYLPLLFSIKQRSIIMGTISSIDESARSYFPLSFEKLVRPAEMWDQYATANLSYSYSKIDSAGAVLEKNEPFNVGTVIKKSLLKFPKLEDTQAFLFSLSLLSEDLTLHSSAFPDPIPKSRSSRTNIQMEIVSLGPLFGRYWSSGNGTISEEGTPYHSKTEYTEKQLLLNVSAQLTLTGTPDNNISVLFLEGLYDQHVGQMYLIGCRDVRASWRILHDSMDLEDGLDCLVEVVVTYPPTTSRWLVSPTARISISSQRTEDDPLYFSPIKLKTFPLMYRKQREDILSRRGVEGILRILTLSLAISCILSQLFYIRENLDSVPYVSLVMLSVQALGYSLPLITGAEAIFKRMETPESYESPSYDLQKSQWLQVIDYTVKLLVLVSFSLTLRLCQKVWKSRVRLLTRAPLEPHRVPSEKRVLLVTSTIHVIGYVIVLVIHSMKTSQRPLHGERFVDSTRNSQTLREWETELVEYVGLIQDFFLLPQIIGNLIWQIHCKPLRKLYFIGITVVRLLPHIYDYMRSPIPNSYFSEEYEFVNP
ncbi:Nucleolar protein, partial [Actinidia chinensis var. chinensis]